MANKEYRPTTPGRRDMTVSDFATVTRSVPEKSLLVGLAQTGGRNSNGRITMRHKGGGHKRKYRVLDFKRTKVDVPAKVAHIEYDPNRTARIALLHYLDGEKAYVLAPQGLKQGQQLLSSDKAEILPGNCLPISSIPVGTNIFNIELKPGKGGQLARSAGAFAQLLGKEGRYASVKLPSGEIRKILVTCRASIGEVSNPEHANLKIGKAGRKRWMGVRPTVRGMVMNPVDHPMGGGEGNSKSNTHPVSPWGTLAKGFKTRKNKRTDKFIVTRRKRKK